MRFGPLAPSEIGSLFLVSLPWLGGIALAVIGTVLLLRLVRATDRIADALERERRER